MGHGPPWTFALVAVTGPKRFARNRATGCAATRIATVSSADTIDRGALAVGRKRSVSGPGNHRRHNSSARGETTASSLAASTPATATDTGWPAGRPLGAKSRLLASG